MSQYTCWEVRTAPVDDMGMRMVVPVNAKDADEALAIVRSANKDHKWVEAIRRPERDGLVEHRFKWRPLIDEACRYLPEQSKGSEGVFFNKMSALAYCLEMSLDQLELLLRKEEPFPPECEHKLRLLGSERGAILAKAKLAQAGVAHYFDWGGLLGA